MPFLGAVLLFFSGKETIVKDFLTELYRNLTLEVLSTDNDSMLRFDALTDLCEEINFRLAKSIFPNQETACLDMKKQAEEISKKYDFFDDDDDDKIAKEEIDEKKPYFDQPCFPIDVVIDQERDGEIEDTDDRKTILYVSPRRESNNEFDEKIHKTSKTKTAVDIEKQVQIDKEKDIRTKLEINKVDIEASKDAEIKKIQDVCETRRANWNFFYWRQWFIWSGWDFWIHSRRFIMDIIDRTTFIADAKRFVQDTEVVEMETADDEKCKMEKQRQDSIDKQERNERAAHENSLMRKVRVKSEFEKEAKIKKTDGK